MVAARTFLGGVGRVHEQDREADALQWSDQPPDDARPLTAFERLRLVVAEDLAQQQPHWGQNGLPSRRAYCIDDNPRSTAHLLEMPDFRVLEEEVGCALTVVGQFRRHWKATAMAYTTVLMADTLLGRAATVDVNDPGLAVLALYLTEHALEGDCAAILYDAAGAAYLGEWVNIRQEELVSELIGALILAMAPVVPRPSLTMPHIQ